MTHTCVPFERCVCTTMEKKKSVVGDIAIEGADSKKGFEMDWSGLSNMNKK